MKNSKGALEFKYCSISENTQFNFLEYKKNTNQFLIQLSSNTKQCLSSIKKQLQFHSCANAPFWSLFRLPTKGYEIQITKTKKCLDHKLKLENCWELSSKMKHEQVFRLQTNKGEYNDKLGQNLLPKTEPQKKEYDPYYELRALEDKVYDKNVLSDVIFNIASQQVKRIHQGKSHRVFKAVDSALIIAFRLAKKGEHDYATALTQAIEPLIENGIDKSLLESPEYRSHRHVAEYLNFARALMKIYTESNRYDLAIPWAQLQFKYQATGVNSRPYMETSIKPTVEFVELALQNLDKPYPIDEEQLEIFILQALDMPLNQRKNTKKRTSILKNMPDSWSKNYGHKKDPYIPKQNPILMGSGVNSLNNNAQYYARAHMYLGYLYARRAEKDPTYSQNANQFLEKAYEILYDNAGSPYWMGRLYSYLTYWAQVAKDFEKQKLYAKTGLEKIQNIQANGVYSELRFKFYEAQLDLFVAEKDYKSAASIANNVFQEFDNNVSVLDVTSTLNQQLILSYRKLLNKSMTALYIDYQNSKSENQQELLEKSLKLAQRLKLTTAGVASQQLKARLKDSENSTNKEYRQLIRQFQDAKKEIIELNKPLKNSFTPLSKNMLVKLRQATEKYSSLKIKIQQKLPRYAVVLAPQIFSLATLQKTLSSKQGILLFRLEEDSTFLWALTSEKATWWRLKATSSEINEQVKKLKSSARDESKKIDKSLANKLYQNVLAKADAFFKHQPNPIDTLFIEADGELQNIPLTLFRRDLENLPNQWFGDQYSLITIPNVGMMTLPKRPQVSYSKENKFFYFAVADPANLKKEPKVSKANAPLNTSDKFPRSGNYDICDMKALPHTKKEVEAIATALNVPHTNLLTGSSATELALKKRSLEDYQVLHFATHAVLSTEPNRESGLVMTPNCPKPITTTSSDDGLLSVSEIATLKLSADSVILSACDTEGGAAAGGEALSGIAQAFLYAGAQSLIVSHWPVDSEVTRYLMIRFTTLWLQKGLTKSAALKQAKVDIRNDPNFPQWTHPYYWAPFVVVSAQP